MNELQNISITLYDKDYKNDLRKVIDAEHDLISVYEDDHLIDFNIVDDLDTDFIQQQLNRIFPDARICVCGERDI